MVQYTYERHGMPPWWSKIGVMCVRARVRMCVRVYVSHTLTHSHTHTPGQLVGGPQSIKVFYLQIAVIGR